MRHAILAGLRGLRHVATYATMAKVPRGNLGLEPPNVSRATTAYTVILHKLKRLSVDI